MLYHGFCSKTGTFLTKMNFKLRSKIEHHHALSPLTFHSWERLSLLMKRGERSGGSSITPERYTAWEDCPSWSRGTSNNVAEGVSTDTACRVPTNRAPVGAGFARPITANTHLYPLRDLVARPPKTGGQYVNREQQRADTLQCARCNHSSPFSALTAPRALEPWL